MRVSHWLGTVASLIFLVSSGFVRAADDSKENSYEMACDGTVVTETAGANDATDISMKMIYTFNVTPMKRVLVLDSMATKISKGDKTAMDYSVDRTTVIDRAHGAEKQMALADMPEKARTVFQDFIGKPLCVVNTNAAGNETGRQILISDAVRRELQGDDFVANVLFFHPDPPPAQDVWSARREMVINGMPVVGTITYKKVSEADGVKSYAVSGSLRPSADSKNPSIQDYGCDIAGEQSFDSKTRVWKSAKLPAQVHFTVVSDGKSPVKAKVDLLFKIVPVSQPKP